LPLFVLEGAQGGEKLGALGRSGLRDAVAVGQIEAGGAHVGEALEVADACGLRGLGPELEADLRVGEEALLLAGVDDVIAEKLALHDPAFAASDARSCADREDERDRDDDQEEREENLRVLFEGD
jgi:hypothetical protein